MTRVLVLSGGGAKGSIQIGCVSELYLSGHRWDAIVGVSAGALNAAGVAFYNPIKTLELWKSVRKMSDVLSQNWISLLWRSGLYSMKPLENLLTTAFKDADIPWLDFYIGITNLQTGLLRFEKGLNNDKLVGHLLASSCIPVVMEHSGYEIDGGVRDTVPLSFAINELNADEIDVVMCQSLDRNQWLSTDLWSSSWPKIINNGIRAADIMSSEVTHGDVQLCIARNNDPAYKKVKLNIYAPKTPPPLDTLDFNSGKILAGIEYGKTMALAPSMRIGYDQ